MTCPSPRYCLSCTMYTPCCIVYTVLFIVHHAYTMLIVYAVLFIVSCTMYRVVSAMLQLGTSLVRHAAVGYITTSLVRHVPKWEVPVPHPMGHVQCTVSHEPCTMYHVPWKDPYLSGVEVPVQRFQHPRHDHLKHFRRHRGQSLSPSPQPSPKP